MEEGLVNNTTKVVTQYEEQLPEIQEKLEIYTDKVEDGKVSGNESEYDSAGSYSEEEHNGIKSHHSEQGTGSETDGSVVLEREEGDGQESVPQKKVDDDEDKKNPQYIPKRGTFYEHDDRTADDIEAVEVVETEKLDKDGKKKIWQDKKEKWSHDRFNDTEQMPKSKSELVTIYGYDIRNEDGPPRARRRRRYGRGPNKYTRNWEDEDAYNKPVATTTPPRNKKTQRGPRTSDEEFPPLVENEELTSSRESMKQNETFRNNKENIRKSVERVESPTPVPTISRNVSQAQHSETHYNSGTSESKTQKFGSGRVSKPNKEIVDSDYKGFTTKTRLNRNMKNQQKIVPKSYPKKDDYIQSQNFTSKNNNNHDIEKQMSQLNVQDGGYKGNKQNNQRQSSMPPRLQMEQKGSKRYSSIRQRSLPETANPPILQHSNYYPNDYNQQTQGNQSGAQAILHQVANPINQIPNTALAPLPQQVPVTTSILQGPPPFVPPPFPQPPTFLPAPVPAPAFLPQQTPQIINYVQTPPPFPQGYQGFPPQFNPVAVEYNVDSSNPDLSTENHPKTTDNTMQANRSQESRMRKKFTMKLKSSEWDNIKRRQRDEKLLKHNTCGTCGSKFNKSQIMKSNPSSTCESNNEQRNTDTRNIRETHSIRSWKNYDRYKNENSFNHVDSSDDDGKFTNQVTVDSKSEVKPSKRYSVLRRRRLQPNNDDSGPQKKSENEYNQQNRINPLKVQQLSLQGPISSQMLVPNVSQAFERASTPVPPLQAHFPAQANFLHLTQQPSFAIQTSQPMSFIPVTSSGHGNFQFNPQDLHGEHFYSAYYPFIVPESKMNMPSVPASYTTKSYMSNDLTGEETQPLL